MINNSISMLKKISRENIIGWTIMMSPLFLILTLGCIFAVTDSSRPLVLRICFIQSVLMAGPAFLLFIRFIVNRKIIYVCADGVVLECRSCFVFRLLTCLGGLIATVLSIYVAYWSFKRNITVNCSLLLFVNIHSIMLLLLFVNVRLCKIFGTFVYSGDLEIVIKPHDNFMLSAYDVERKYRYLEYIYIRLGEKKIEYNASEVI